MGDLFHVRCVVHILNLIVQDGLKVILPMLVNVQETIKYVKSSTSRKEKFRLISQVNAPDLSLVADVSTRWNSTVNMLETAIKFRDAFVRLAECDGSYKFLPSDDDWKHMSVEWQQRVYFLIGASPSVNQNQLEDRSVEALLEEDRSVEALLERLSEV